MAFSHEYQEMVAEIKILGFPKDAPKNKKYHWVYIKDGKIIRLSFQEMKTNYRKFAEGELKIIPMKGEKIVLAEYKQGTRTVNMSSVPIHLNKNLALIEEYVNNL